MLSFDLLPETRVGAWLIVVSVSNNDDNISYMSECP